ncbi:hypothetical protein PITCH_A240004 [uncultured Desulfobacterium sp.]|uniref:Uncharacterized protein n=1 Tax=uncultured Desulfobacterium sp. TaxID=201089 RepID=A0A445MYP0_9BACT|nr:hypothetical protein PITCH_A240004 [uncultured Desulfobacterium sp.]
MTGKTLLTKRTEGLPVKYGGSIEQLSRRLFNEKKPQIVPTSLLTGIYTPVGSPAAKSTFVPD